MPKPVDGREQRDEKRSQESGTCRSSGRGLSDLTTATSPQYDHFISNEEAIFYYYGLTKSIASTPRLIARSGTDPFLIEFELAGGWELPRESMKKRMSIAKSGSHSITSTYDSRLRMRIREILREIDWRCIDITRIGRNICQDDNEVVVLVTCPKAAKVDHTTGMRLVRRCQELLDECGLGDIRVEIKEGNYVHLAGEDEIRGWLFDQVPCIGTSIGVTHGDGITMKCSSGTLGLYLKMGGDTVPYGLTCRCVVFPPSRPPPGGPKSGFTYTEGYFGVDAPSSADRQEEIADIEVKLEYEEKSFARKGGLKDQQEIMGKDLQQGKKDQIDQYLKDTNEFRAKLTMDDLHEEDRVQIKNFYRPIEGIVPISEIKASTTRPIPTDGDRHCHPSLRVLKCGLKTGWTIAEAASIRSDCQRTRGHISMEIFIPNAFALAQFSAVGDSGSIVFDFRGRAVGMIHGGNAKEGSTENIATYATPIEDLLKDIEQELGVSVAIA